MGLAGKIARLLSFDRVSENHSKKPQSDVKVDPGGGDTLTVEHMADPGDDSFPLEKDYLFIAAQNRAGRYVAGGYADVVNTPRAEKGDKRIYGRKSDDGTWVCEVWLKNDGTIFINNKIASTTMTPGGTVITTNGSATWTLASSSEISGVNGSGYYILEAGGDFLANGAKMTTSGDVITSDGVSLRNHTHNQGNDTAGDQQQSTNAPTPTE